MQWLNQIVDEVIHRHSDGEILISSGVSPSGTYHLGTLREVLTAEAVLRELKRRGRTAKHIHVVDDLDIFRKVPVDVPAEFEKYLGMPLCDVPSPNGSGNYADYFLKDLLDSAQGLRLEMEVMRAHEKYRSGFFVPAIEKALDNVASIRRVLESVSGHKLGEEWSPVQVLEDGYLKNRKFLSIDTDKKELTFEDKDGQARTTSYQKGEVKLNWRIDWPARWALLGVNVEPFGRDHATKGGSYDTGAEIVRQVFGAEPPLPVPYNFINRTGDTKKMSKSKGDTVTAADLLKILPAEIVWFFILRYSPDKLLFFDTGDTLMRLFDEFGELLAKPDKTETEKQLTELCLMGVDKPTVSRVPFSHLVASYQAALKNPAKALEVIARTEHAEVVKADSETIQKEFDFIDAWLEHWAPEEIKFELAANPPAGLNENQKQFLNMLADKIESLADNADGEHFHKAIYECREASKLEPKEMFSTLYQTLIGKNAGPRAGWFLSILPRDWLIDRLRLKPGGM